MTSHAPDGLALARVEASAAISASHSCERFMEYTKTLPWVARILAKADEKTRARIAAPKEHVKQPKVTPDERAKITALRKQGLTIAEISSQVGRGYATVWRVIRRKKNKNTNGVGTK